MSGPSVDDLRRLHHDAIDGATAFVDTIGPDDLDRETPCAGWRLCDLLAHMIGQHLGFARAVTDGDAPPGAYQPVAFGLPEWRDSVEQIETAFAQADPQRTVVELELSPDALPLAVVIAAQLLDTVIHTWDLATALGREFVPTADLLAPVAAMALAIPDSAYGPGRAFAGRLPDRGSEWDRTLSSVGRQPTP
jgi:uncharacterized protein (TIGR03086 family)